MKIIFAGTPEISVPTLTALLHSSYHVQAVLTQPDRPAGRGQQLTPSPVKTLALEHGVTVLQPTTLKDADIQAQLQQLQPDIIVVIAYGLLVPQAVLDLPRCGCVNLHVSLLPRWRGASPIQQAILAGDAMTGVSLMQMEAGLDTGPIFATRTLPIETTDTSGSLHDKLATLSAELLLEQLPHISDGTLISQPQPEVGVTYAPKITKEEAAIDWSQSAGVIARQIRAYNPWPIAYTHFGEQRVRLWQATVNHTPTTTTPGTVIAIDKTGVQIACGEGILCVEQLQWPGGKVQAASANMVQLLPVGTVAK